MRRRPGSLDADAHRLQELAELDDVRLHRGVADLGGPGRGGRREQRRFRSGDRRLVEIERRALQPVRRVQRVARLVERLGAQRDRAPRGASRWCGAPGSRRPEAPAAPSRAAPAAARAAAPSRAAGRPASGRDGRWSPSAHWIRSVAGAAPLDARAEPSTESSSTSTSRMRGTLVELARLIGQHAGGDQRQRRVLVPFDGDASRTARRPPSIMHAVAMISLALGRHVPSSELPGRRSLRAARRRIARGRASRQRSISRRMSPRWRRPR